MKSFSSLPEKEIDLQKQGCLQISSKCNFSKLINVQKATSAYFKMKSEAMVLDRYVLLKCQCSTFIRISSVWYLVDSPSNIKPKIE